MTDLTLTSSLNSPNNQAEPPAHFVWMLAILIFFYALWQALIVAERRYDRTALARVYRARHRLKRADGHRVLDYPVNDAMRRRAAAACRRGTPAVPPVKSFEAHCQEVLEAVVIALDPTHPAHVRRRVLKELSCFPQLVLALYGGEREHARDLGLKSPHEQAEERLAREFGLSASSIRHRCVQARRDTKSAAFEPMTLTAFWQELDRFGHEITTATAS